MTAKIERLSDLRARIGSIVLSAPDKFPMVGSFVSDQRQNLLIAFDILQEAFPLVERKIKDPAQLERLRQLLREALIAYQHGERRKGAHLLQDFQDIVFPNRFKMHEERERDM